jgi:hypothetical protein
MPACLPAWDLWQRRYHTCDLHRRTSSRWWSPTQIQSGAMLHARRYPAMWYFVVIVVIVAIIAVVVVVDETSTVVVATHVLQHFSFRMGICMFSGVFLARNFHVFNGGIEREPTQHNRMLLHYNCIIIVYYNNGINISTLHMLLIEFK